MATDWNRFVTNIKTAMEEGKAPWVQPWDGSQMRSAISGQAYHGVNVWQLGLTATSRGFQSPLWLTMKQASNAGGSVLHEEAKKYTDVMFWKFLRKTDEKTGEEKSFPIARFFRLYNLEQTEDVQIPKKVRSAMVRDIESIPDAESIIESMPKRPYFAGVPSDRAYYLPTADTIVLPQKGQFHSSSEYYSTVFHELAHSTGHKSRLNRFTEGKIIAPFGSQEYSKEELVAEMAAAFICQRLAISNESAYRNSAAYLRGWLSVLKNDPLTFVSACGAGSKAAAYILNESGEEGTEEEEGAE